MNQQIPEEFLKAMDVQNQSPVRIERNSMQEIGDNEITKSHNDKTRSYAVQLSSSILVIEKTNESAIPEAYQKQIIDQLSQMKQQKEMYYQVITEEPSSSSTSKDIATQIRGGDLGKSGPGARAKADAARNARKGSIVVGALSPHNIYCRYHENCSPKSRLGPLFGRSNTPSISREERRELNRQRTQPNIFDKNITIPSQDLQLTTPVDLSQEVSINDLKQTAKSQRKVQLLKSITNIEKNLKILIIVQLSVKLNFSMHKFDIFMIQRLFAFVVFIYQKITIHSIVVSILTLKLIN